MQFRLTYEGKLLAHRDDERLPERSLHVHDIRKKFHKQLGNLWTQHPVFKNHRATSMPVIGAQPFADFTQDGFLFRPIVIENNGLVCELDILMLRDGSPGHALQDLDNRLKTIFDALRMAKSSQELGQGTSKGKQSASTDENPFYVLLQDDRLITHVAVTTDTLLDPVPNTSRRDAVRLVITVTIRPYDVNMENLAFT